MCVHLAASIATTELNVAATGMVFCRRRHLFRLGRLLDARAGDVPGSQRGRSEHHHADAAGPIAQVERDRHRPVHYHLGWIYGYGVSAAR